MDAVEQARRYVAKIPGAVSGNGGHPQTFSVACALVHGFALSDSDAWAVLTEYNRTCSPAWSEKELRHKLESAKAATTHEKPRGHLLSKQSVKYKFGAGGGSEKGAQPSMPSADAQSRASGMAVARPAPAPSSSQSGHRYDLAETPLPDPIPDGARELLRLAFAPGEWIGIAPAYEDEKDGKERPKEAAVHPFEWWMDKFSQREPNQVFFSRKEIGEGKNGIYVAINPITAEKTRANGNVAAYRHVLIEFDDEALSLGRQWDLIQKSRIPCTAVVSSGGRSLHAWVRVDAQSEQEWRERMRILHAHFAEDQKPDKKNNDPARLSRLAGSERGTNRQELLSRQCGEKDFETWLSLRSPSDTGLPPFEFGDELELAEIVRPAEIINDLLHAGDKMVISGGSKMNKTWTLIDLGLSVATGKPWWGRETRQGSVLYINFEIRRYFFRNRLRAIAKERGVEIPKTFVHWPLRGFAASIELLVPRLIRGINQHRFDLIILDPIYKALGWRDENKAGDINDLLNEVEKLITGTGAAVVFANHFSKGNQSLKQAIDRQSGSGVFARDPDVLMSMTPHAEENCLVIDSTLRNVAPIQPFVVRWEYPCFRIDTSMNPQMLREIKPKNKPVPPNDEALRLELLTPKGMPKGMLISALRAKGMSKDSATGRVDEWCRKGFGESFDVPRSGTRAEKHIRLRDRSNE